MTKTATKKAKQPPPKTDPSLMIFAMGDGAIPELLHIARNKDELRGFIAGMKHVLDFGMDEFGDAPEFKTGDEINFLDPALWGFE